MIPSLSKSACALGVGQRRLAHYNSSLSFLSLQAIADVPTDRGAYTSFPLPIISLCAILIENEAIGKNLAFSDQCLKTCRNSTKISGSFETFFSIWICIFYKKNTNCKKFQKIRREKFRITVAQVFRKNLNSKKISKKFQKILNTDILKNCRK